MKLIDIIKKITIKKQFSDYIMIFIWVAMIVKIIENDIIQIISVLLVIAAHIINRHGSD